MLGLRKIGVALQSEMGGKRMIPVNGSASCGKGIGQSVDIERISRSIADVKGRPGLYICIPPGGFETRKRSPSVQSCSDWRRVVLKVSLEELMLGGEVWN